MMLMVVAIPRLWALIGAEDCGEYRQAAGTVAEGLDRAHRHVCAPRVSKPETIRAKCGGVLHKRYCMRHASGNLDTIPAPLPEVVIDLGSRSHRVILIVLPRRDQQSNEFLLARIVVHTSHFPHAEKSPNGHNEHDYDDQATDDFHARPQDCCSVNEVRRSFRLLVLKV
jgi:hypothetical protein